MVWFTVEESKNERMKAIQDKREAEEAKAKLLDEYEEEKELTFAVTTNMTRQYLSMQKDFLNRLDERDNTIKDLKDQLGMFHISRALLWTSTPHHVF